MKDTDVIATSPPVHDIHKRQVNPPPQFEDMERQYLYDMSMNYLKLFVGYVEYVNNNDNATKSYLEEMVRDQGAKLNHMSSDEMRKYVGNMMTAMTDGVNTEHEITIDGSTYSLDHIASWCCPF